MGWKRVTAASAVVLFVLGFTAWPFVRAHLQAVAILKLVSGETVPKLLTAVIEEKIESKEIEFPAGA